MSQALSAHGEVAAPQDSAPEKPVKNSVELALDERLALTKFLITMSTECGESLDAAQKEAKQEMDRIVAQADKQALHRLKAQARLTNTDRSGARRAQQATPSSSLSSTSTSSHDIGKRTLQRPADVCAKAVKRMHSTKVFLSAHSRVLPAVAPSAEAAGKGSTKVMEKDIENTQASDDRPCQHQPDALSTQLKPPGAGSVAMEHKNSSAAADGHADLQGNTSLALAFDAFSPASTGQTIGDGGGCQPQGQSQHGMSASTSLGEAQVLPLAPRSALSAATKVGSTESPGACTRPAKVDLSQPASPFEHDAKPRTGWVEGQCHAAIQGGISGSSPLPPSLATKAQPALSSGRGYRGAAKGKGKRVKAYTHEQWLWMRDRIAYEKVLPFQGEI